MRIDLNLYNVFEAIHSEGNLTKAAEKLFITQPAISHSLSKLRDAYQDPLFIRQGHKMVPTPLAEKLQPEISHALSTLNSALMNAQTFDPKRSQKQFRVALRDVLESTCLPPIMSLLEKTAPMVSIVSLRHDRETMERDLSSGKIDLVIDVAQPVSNQIIREPIISETLCVLANAKHPRIGTVLTLENYLAERHVIASSRSSGMTFEDNELNRYGLSRNIALRCQHYFAASKVIRNTELLLTMPKSYGRLLIEENTGLAMHDFPIESPALDIHVFSHKSRELDQELNWFKSLLQRLI